MIGDLLLLSGNDIPFLDAKVNIHQPTIKEIAYIGEESFYTGIQFLNFSKDILLEEDKSSLADKTDFDIFMSMMNSRDSQIRKNKTCAFMVLTLMFPNHKIHLTEDSITLIHVDTKEMSEINNHNYGSFKEILTQMFCIAKSKSQDDGFKPVNDMAKKIAEKLMKGRQKVAAARNESQKIAVLSRYISILSIGRNMDINTLLKYTVYQLYDVFERYTLYQNYDFNFRARLAGAKDLEEVENWMKDIHS